MLERATLRIRYVAPACPADSYLSSPKLLDEPFNITLYKLSTDRRGELHNTSLKEPVIRYRQERCSCGADGHAMLRLFDAHCHLQSVVSLQDARIGTNVAKVIQEAHSEGVRKFACNGCWEGDWEKVQSIAREHDAVIPNFGLHPWWVKQRKYGWLERLREQLLAHQGAGLGECGLDYAKADAAGHEEQAEVFSQQLHLGNELRRPISVHCVKAFGALSETVQKAGPYPAGLVLHSWAGSADMTKQLAKIEGVYFSISGHTFSLSDKKLTPILQQVPLDRLLLETDSPDGLLGLQKRQAFEQKLGSMQGPEGNEDINHPANIRVVLALVSSIMVANEESIADATFRNACKVFGVST